MTSDKDVTTNRKEGRHRWRLTKAFPWFGKLDEAADNEGEPDDLGQNVAAAPPTANSSRRVFGFPCSPDLSFTVRLLHKELALPIYPVAEHALGLGCAQIAQDISDEASRQALHTHLLEEHFLRPSLDAGNSYDMNTAVKMRVAQLRHWELDRLAHEIVRVIDRERVPSQLLVMTIEKLVSDVRRRRNAQAAARFDQRRGYQPRNTAATDAGSGKEE